MSKEARDNAQTTKEVDICSRSFRYANSDDDDSRRGIEATRGDAMTYGVTSLPSCRATKENAARAKGGQIDERLRVQKNT